MRVLVACEFSAIVRDAFRNLGHDAWSVDLLPSEGSAAYHFQGDALKRLDFGWDLLIAHPPCTYLANSGARWLYEKEGRFTQMQEAGWFFRALLEAPIKRIAIENPIMHGPGLNVIGRKYDQTMQPYEYGHMETKRTCLWLKNLPKLVPTTNLKAATQALPKRESARVHYQAPGANRWKERSRTYPGIAAAMASQWGSLPSL